MSNTVGIFRNLLALRRSRSAFGLKYCTSRKGDTDSDKDLSLRVDETGEGDRGVEKLRSGDGTPGRGTKIADLGHSKKGESSSIRQSPPLHIKDNVKVQVEDRVWEENQNVVQKTSTFTSMLRSSPLMDLGDPVGKLAVGTIYRIVEKSAYIDFGWKFPAVCSLTEAATPGHYKLGSKVVVQIKDLELTTKFLGDTEYTSLLEADCNLICLYELNRTVQMKNPSEKMTAAS